MQHSVPLLHMYIIDVWKQKGGLAVLLLANQPNSSMNRAEVIADFLVTNFFLTARLLTRDRSLFVVHKFHFNNILSNLVICNIIDWLHFNIANCLFLNITQQSGPYNSTSVVYIFFISFTQA